MAAAAAYAAGRPRTIVVRLNIMYDCGARGAKGLTLDEMAQFRRYQEKARREYELSGIRFDLHFTDGAFLRTQGYSEIPDRFLLRDRINLFVTESLGYDIDRDRSGGCSVGPRPRAPRVPPDPFYKTFLGLRDAREATLEHEYAHHFTLDTLHHPTVTGNLWSDLRNDYWLWRQRHGAAIAEFRACANAPWAAVS